MPVMDSLTNNLVNKEVAVHYLEEGINKKAKDDFCFLVNQGGLSYYVKLNHVCVCGSSAKLLADTAVLGAEYGTSMVKVPKSELNVAEAGKVAVVVYNKESVAGIYLFDMEKIKSKTGLFGRFKDLKKEDMYGIKLAGIEKLVDNKFGVVFSDYLRK